MLRVWLLGTLALEIDGVKVTAQSSRGARLVLATLALERRPHSREALAARLWPGVLRSSARASLRTALTQLRRALGDDAALFLHASREHVALAGPIWVWTDVAEVDAEVDVFDEETATAYLTEHARRPGDRKAARRLAAALGQLPLALAHAAAYCQSGTSFTEYLTLLSDLPARELFDSHPELSHAQTVASTWRTSLREANEAAPLAADVLAMAAHVGPDTIPKSLLVGIVDGDL